MGVYGTHPHVLDLLLEVGKVATLQAGAALAGLLCLVPGVLLALSVHLRLAACLLQVCACTTSCWHAIPAHGGVMKADASPMPLRHNYSAF